MDEDDIKEYIRKYGITFISFLTVICYIFPILVILRIWFNIPLINKLLATDIVLIIFSFIYILVKD